MKCKVKMFGTFSVVALNLYLGILCLYLIGYSQTTRRESHPAQLFHIGGHSVLKTYNFENSPLGIFTFPSVTFQDQDGNYWIGEDSGDKAYQLNPHSQTWTIFETGARPAQSKLHYEGGAILPVSTYGINQSKDGKIWFTARETMRRMTGRDTDVSFYDGKKWEHHQIAVDEQNRWRIGVFKGSNDKLWFWNHNQLKSYDGKKWSTPIELSRNIYRLSKSASVKTGEAGISKDSSLQEKRKFEIFDAIQDREGFIWLCTRSGIFRFDERRNEFKRLHQSKLAIALLVYEDQLGRIWFSDSFSVELYNKKENATILFNILDQIGPGKLISVRAIYQDNRGQMFFGLNKGLLVFSEYENKWTYFNLKEFDSQDVFDDIGVEHILEDKLKRVWLTTTAGILVLEK